jgi:TonB family protein
MKICPKCAQSFADGFKYCPRDATELTKYDLRAQIHSQSGLQFLVKNKSLWSRLRDEIADAVREIKRNPHKYLSSLLRGEGSSRRRRMMLQAGVATAVITYTSLVLLVILVGLWKAPMTGTKADNLRPKDDFLGPVRLAFEDQKPATDTKKGRGLLGGSMKQPRRSGGGGGANDKTPTSKGQISLTSFSPQINLPDVSQPKAKPLLVVPETIVVDPIFSRRLNGPIGIQEGQLEAPSPGNRGGTGIGNGQGPGYNSGKNGNIGDGPNMIGGGTPTGPGNGGSDVMSGKPTILYTERAKFTEEARRERIQGTVVLSVVFGADGLLHDIRTLQGLPYGLTENAIEAAKRIRFQPAILYGKPVSVRTTLEFNFALY